MSEGRVDSKHLKQQAQSEQLGEITESIVAMAQLDFKTPPSIRGDGPLDAVAVGLVALGEELQASLAAQRVAEEANESKTRFLANISHELRTPLTTIIGSSELLKETALDESQHRLVRQVCDASGLLMRLITDVLDFSKIEAGKLSIEAHPFRLRDCLHRVVAPHRLSATGKGLVLEERWLHIEDVEVQGDGHRLEQVLSNLVGNAVKYTTEGRILLDGELEETEDGILLQFRIQDTGPGIPAEQHGRIFDRFTMGDSSNRRRQPGAGLGLSISKALIDAMGGLLRLESTLGLGSTFYVQIPVERVHLELDVPNRDPCRQTTKCRVLLVDDTAAVRTVVADMLRMLGCSVEVADSGKEALAKVAEQDFDLILMDCQMPSMDGLECARKMLSLYPERGLQIVALTAHSSRQDELKSRAAGMVEHLNKPFRIDQLEALVERFQSKQ